MPGPWRMPVRAVALLLAGLTMGGVASADPAQGRALYQGTAGFEAGIEATASRLPARFAACSNCHGHGGAGASEGGVIAPPLLWAKLTAPSGTNSAFRSGEEVLRAVTIGMGRNNELLSPAMPRYRLSPNEARSLLAYLEVLGTRADLPPGISANEIRIGTALPLSGPAAATGAAILQGLHDSIDPLNAQGGIHGRTVMLISADTVPRGPAVAVRELAKKPVYALAASLWPDSEPEAERLLTEARIPNLASLVVREKSREAGEWDFDLLPPVEEQQKLLAGAMATCGNPARRTALAIGTEGPRPSSVRWVISASDLAATFEKSATTGGRDECVGFGLAAIGLSSAAPPSAAQRIVLPMPEELLSEGGAASEPWRRLGEAAGRVVIELLANAGAVPHERSTLDALSALSGFEPLPGLPPLRFSRTRRFGWDPGLIAIPARADPGGTARRTPFDPAQGG
ncbi:ABC transporter substrate-binding protein [Mesorhizobium sp. RP14(2022)]|uniref:ABC transporter substrate-binding protein n=1 Tax=Mesorhizobium liriopis TaxID=2953882 RepID=A0ABT1CCV4_9HYPH|nr:ABC transporter substrate-binding protein [Mesorhizobium liriopis]MCO6051771.1 ABC transporter substrate-binding protein [Mesorhizobium liriopis]